MLKHTCKDGLTCHSNAVGLTMKFMNREERMTMAHVQKFKRSEMNKLISHDARQPDENRERSNESIDPERTRLNYNLAWKFQGMKPLDFIDERMKDVYVYGAGTRREEKAVRVFEWVLTLPKDVPSEREKEFFQRSLDFMCDKYGKQNVVYAWVHKDEVTPHMHVAVLPIVKREVTAKSHNRNNGKTEKLDCKSILSRSHLDTFHQELDDYIYEKMGQRYEILNGATDKGNKTVQQLKAETLAKKNEEAEKRNQELLLQNQQLEKMNREMLSGYEKQATEEVQNWFENASDYISGRVKKSGKEIVKMAEQMPKVTEMINGLKECQRMTENELYRQKARSKALQKEQQEFAEYKSQALRQLSDREHQIDERDNQLVEDAVTVARYLNAETRTYRQRAFEQLDKTRQQNMKVYAERLEKARIQAINEFIEMEMTENDDTYKDDENDISERKETKSMDFREL